MVSAFISRVILLVFGTLYPAYRSYKAIKNKDVREYVKWMMYWIIFALFTAAETFADVFISWLPMYYEVKIVFIIWLLSPATKGSSILYRKFVHPRLIKNEKAIDRYIDKAQKNSYATLMDVGKKGLNVATDTLMKTAVSGQIQLVQTLKKYNSMQELNVDTTDAAVSKNQRPRVATWYGAPTQNFNPDDDLEILQQQYERENFEEEEEERYERTKLMKSTSDLVEESHTRQTYLDSDGLKMTSEDINYTYSSNTLPRARKSRKKDQHIQTRSKRSSKNISGEE